MQTLLLLRANTYLFIKAHTTVPQKIACSCMNTLRFHTKNTVVTNQHCTFSKNNERRTRRYVNNSRNLPTSHTQRTQRRNIPFEGTLLSDMCFSSLVLHDGPKSSKTNKKIKNPLTPIGSCRDLHMWYIQLLC